MIRPLVVALPFVLALPAQAMAAEPLTPEAMNASFVSSPGLATGKQLPRCDDQNKDADKTGAHCTSVVRSLDAQQEQERLLAREIAATESVTVRPPEPQLTLPLLDVPTNQGTGAGQLSQNGQQVQLNILGPVPIQGSFQNSRVGLDTSGAGATLRFNLPAR